ncbi:MAG: hypothetical protein DMG32_01695 [Acidobacteria bacterium]|nr:MAG: hypothetical protein DMG32_01695 [Acidobacteriota bacterium]
MYDAVLTIRGCHITQRRNRALHRRDIEVPSEPTAAIARQPPFEGIRMPQASPAPLVVAQAGAS